MTDIVSQILMDVLESATRSAERWQKVWEREKELSEFHAFQQCPKCDEFGFCLISKVEKRFVDSKVMEAVMRECSHCGHIWPQEK